MKHVGTLLVVATLWETVGGGAPPRHLHIASKRAIPRHNPSQFRHYPQAPQLTRGVQKVSCTWACAQHSVSSDLLATTSRFGRNDSQALHIDFTSKIQNPKQLAMSFPLIKSTKKHYFFGRTIRLKCIKGVTSVRSAELSFEIMDSIRY